MLCDLFCLTVQATVLLAAQSIKSDVFFVLFFYFLGILFWFLEFFCIIIVYFAFQNCDLYHFFALSDLWMRLTARATVLLAA